MDVQLLRTLVSVAEHGSFSAAAAHLNCVQSNVTTRIKRLEAHLGQPLFDRGRGGASLTPFGETAYKSATDLIAHFEAAERDLLDQSHGAAPLRLGAMETTAAARLPKLIKALKDKCPKAPVSLETGPTGHLLSRLSDRRIDAAFVAGPIDPGRFAGTLAFRERLVIAHAGATPPAGPLLAFRQSCSYRATAMEWLRSEGRLDTEIVEMGTFEGILGCVETGMGFAIAPERAVRTYRPARALTLSPLPKRFAEIDTSLAWRRDTRPTHAMIALKNLLGGA